jgi:simple sugar transport system permease protein/D-xylose transport system permease protein
MTAQSNPLPADRQDSRLRQDEGIRGMLTASVERIRRGDLGLLPVIIGIVVIYVIFQSLNPFFLSSNNMANLLMESTAVGFLALGIVFVLLLGQIDLSVGSVSGLSSAIFAVTFVGNGWPLVLAIMASVATGMAIGYLYGQIFNRIGVPSFVISVAGLLGFLGLQLWVLRGRGTINLPFESPLVWFGQQAFLPPLASYILMAGVGVVFYLLRTTRSFKRRQAGLSARGQVLIISQTVLLVGVLEFIAWYLNQSRGISMMFSLFVLVVLIAHYVLTRTQFGRSLFAVGGNPEAARRAGINVPAIYTAAFMITSTLSAVGGLLAAGRLAAAAQSSGGGDTNLTAIAAAVIGGTSLFGGRGSAFSALLGVIVIASISSGLTLLNLDPSIRFMVTGAVVLIAVAVDAVARRSRAASGVA